MVLMLSGDVGRVFWCLNFELNKEFYGQDLGVGIRFRRLHGAGGANHEDPMDVLSGDESIDDDVLQEVLKHMKKKTYFKDVRERQELLHEVPYPILHSL